MNESLDAFDYPPVKPFTISDHVREMHDGGVGIEQICWRLKLRRETIERWIGNTTSLAAKGTSEA
tara:strand:+ start:728 stop:922 length:195 start_codon:yes stop_codon:yes gene_type:complete